MAVLLHLFIFLIQIFLASIFASSNATIHMEVATSCSGTGACRFTAQYITLQNTNCSNGHIPGDTGLDHSSSVFLRLLQQRIFQDKQHGFYYATIGYHGICCRRMSDQIAEITSEEVSCLRGQKPQI